MTVEVTVEIGRSPEDAFDYLTDVTNEAEWNPRTRRVEKLTEGPIGSRMRFGAEWIKGNPMVVEYAAFERPTAWTSIAHSRRLDAKGEGRISRTERGSRLMVRAELRPKGLLAPLLPLGWLERCTSERRGTLRRSTRSWRAAGRDRRRLLCDRAWDLG